MNAPEQAELFAVEATPATAVSGIAAGRPDPGAYDTVLAGDGYGWLADLLSAPQPPVCERCGTPMVLPAAAPVLWACPACHPQEATPSSAACDLRRAA
jgi:hypothetical protein